jgi:Kinetochore CENP-C fungal homologue, Mif2, N-terminal
VKDTGRRNSAGLEDMDAFFSPNVEKSPKKTRLSPHGKLLSYTTKFQTAIQSDNSVPMSGTSSKSKTCCLHAENIGSIRDPKEVLASRRSLLAHRNSVLE